MIIRARVQDGVVVLEPGASLPEGTEVTVGVCAATNATGEKMSDKQRRRIREIVDRIIALPDENPGDTFSGADHDQVLYGKP